MVDAPSMKECGGVGCNNPAFTVIPNFNGSALHVPLCETCLIIHLARRFPWSNRSAVQALMSSAQPRPTSFFDVIILTPNHVELAAEGELPKVLSVLDTLDAKLVRAEIWNAERRAKNKENSDG